VKVAKAWLLGDKHVLVISLILSLPLWAVAWYVARDGRQSLSRFFAVGALCAFGPLFLYLLLPTLILHFFCLAIVVVVIREGAVHPRRYALPATLAATCAAYAIGILWAARGHTEYDRLRALYPLESLAGRLPPEPDPGERRALAAPASVRLEQLEAQLNSGNFRAHTLESLHEHTLALFVNSPGFGVARLMLPSESLLRFNVREVGPVSQPVPRASSPGEFAGPPGLAKNDDDYNLHTQSVADFANMSARGYVRDRQHVAGFQPHRFSEVPGLGFQRLSVETVELVGLLRFSQPAVYVSADLPRMDELRDAPTRALDGFESAALQWLRDGEDLVACQSESHVRMLGSIRNAKQCLDCHGGERGDLLGAFSYTLMRKSSQARR
jgi:hypothetical protein